MTARCRRPIAHLCHEKEAKDYATSIHGVSHLLGASGAAELLGLPRLAWHSSGQVIRRRRCSK